MRSFNPRSYCSLKHLRIFFLSIFLLFSGVLMSQKISQEESYVKNKLAQIDSLINIGQHEKANSLINNTINTFSFRKNSEEQLAFDFRIAKNLYYQGNKEKGLNEMLVGLDKLKSKPFSPLNIDYSNELAKIFADSENFEKAIYYNKIALQKSYLIKDTIGITRSLIRMGGFYYAKNEEDSAKIYFKKMARFPVTPLTEKRIGDAYNNLGVIAQNNENYDLAKARGRQALELKTRLNDVKGIAYSNVNLGNLYHYENDYKTAIGNYLAAFKQIENDTTRSLLYLKRIIYENLSVSYDSIKDYENAYKYLHKSYQLKFKLTNEQLAENNAEVEARYNLAVEERKTEEEKSKALRAQFLFYGLAFVTLTFVILAFIFYKNYKLKEQNRLEQVHNNLQTRIINATIDAKEKERKSIAEILHDSVSALLSSANLHLQASKAQLNSHVPIEITKAQEIVNEASVKIRDLSHELISSVLLKFGLAFAVHDLCEKYSNSEIQFISDDNGIKRYNQQFEIKIYNIIEELINNIMKHSGAKNASINLIERNGEKLLIQIIDDGKGFELKKARKKDGLGLSHIEARIKIMKGVFNINTKRGEGTSIFISVPIYQPELSEAV
ncbi:histidine kinase [Lutimonas halocynthiae]|uniref:tetratricopeptide repeat-containing sensor histidine kinase n=1 Tax=Lutimonas halocynthiae TaxID=1446477 RepID=UPI0025B3B4F1|nr:tetratricopeptide repeat-containing sensor histidine kinase [Lutimonas halocynthiae]MDN3642153.1 histidine kinase [Lutimonas halocynthiae]